jgi:Flp pilus assembly protein CpaB
MNKKQLIQLSIICLAFAGAGFVLYKGGIFGQPQALKPASQISVKVNNLQPILPHGEDLELKQVILPDRFDYRQYEFGKVSKSEVGVEPENLITPLQNP